MTWLGDWRSWLTLAWSLVVLTAYAGTVLGARGDRLLTILRELSGMW
jgi:hypothetical protein